MAQVPRYSPEHGQIITICTEVAKVMFLQASVCPWRGVCLSACWDTPPEQTPPGADTPGADTPQSRHPPGADTPLGADTPQEQTPPQSRHPPRADTPKEQTSPPGRDGHCCGWYASYWNAFLFRYMSEFARISKFFGMSIVKLSRTRSHVILTVTYWNLISTEP